VGANKHKQRQSTVVDVGRISVGIPDALERALRFTTVERFGGKKGDLTRTVADAVQTWIAKEA
jgi:hypothetical protein